MPRKMADGADAPSTVDHMIQIIDKHNFEVGSKTWVRVTHINHPQSFYVRIRTLDPHMGVVEQRGVPVDPSDVNRQIKILYKSRIEDKYIRGKVFFISDMDRDVKCDIYAIDYGFFEKEIPISEICTIGNTRDHEIPPLAMHCQLANCFPYRGEWCKDATETLKYYVGTERAMLTVREKRPDVHVVELQNSCPDDFAKMLAYAGCSSYGYADNTVTRFNIPGEDKHLLIHKNLKIGDTLHVRVQSGKDPAGFFVADKKDYKVYLNERINLSHTSARLNSLSIDEIQVDKHVAVYMHSACKYERGIVKQVLRKERVLVQLVDLGNIIEVNVILLKSVSGKFYHCPVTAIFCSIVDQTLPCAISRLLLGTEFLITVVKVGYKFDVPHQVSISLIQ